MQAPALTYYNAQSLIGGNKKIPHLCVDDERGVKGEPEYQLVTGALLADDEHVPAYLHVHLPSTMHQPDAHTVTTNPNPFREADDSHRSRAVAYSCKTHK